MADNVIDLAAFRKKRQGEEPQPGSPITAVISDRAHYLLHDNHQLEVYTGFEHSWSESTRNERALMQHISFLEGTIVQLLEKHAPDMLYDDYIVTPFIDWDQLVKLKGPAIEEWHANYQDSPEIILSRRVHLMVKEAREKMHHISFTNRLGLAVSEEIKHGKILKAKHSPMMVFIAGPEDLPDGAIKASFKAIRPGNLVGATNGGTFQFVFADNSARAAFIARLMSFANMEQVRTYLNDLPRSLGNGKVEFS